MFSAWEMDTYIQADGGPVRNITSLWDLDSGPYDMTTITNLPLRSRGFQFEINF